MGIISKLLILISGRYLTLFIPFIIETTSGVFSGLYSLLFGCLISVFAPAISSLGKALFLLGYSGFFVTLMPLMQ